MLRTGSQFIYHCTLMAHWCRFHTEENAPTLQKHQVHLGSANINLKRAVHQSYSLVQSIVGVARQHPSKAKHK